MTNITRLVVGTGMALLACGDSGDSGGGLAVKEFPQRVAKVVCDAFERCLGPALELFLQGASCIEGGGQSILDELSDLDALIAAGRVKYDGDAANKCLSELGQVACADLDVAFDTKCDAALSGTVKVGGDCDRDIECASGGVCVLDQACPGKCQATKEAGTACTSDEECADGLNCDTGVCAMAAAMGKPCGDDIAGCTIDALCTGDDSTTSTPGTCTALSTVFAGQDGDDCDFDQGKLCATGLSCVVTSASTMDVDSKCQKPAASGAACNFGLPTPCPAGQYCNADVAQGKISGTCVDLPAAGKPCVAVPGAPACDGGLVCLGSGTASCQAAASLGEACDEDDGCTSGHCSSGKCTPGFGCAL